VTHSADNDAPAPVYKPEGYTDSDQRADTAFLVGVRFGRESERAKMLAEGYVIPPGMSE
jgi:hypothetical protein